MLLLFQLLCYTYMSLNELSSNMHVLFRLINRVMLVLSNKSKVVKFVEDSPKVCMYYVMTEPRTNILEWINLDLCVKCRLR